jgi:hypothetical protein
LENYSKFNFDYREPREVFDDLKEFSKNIQLYPIGDVVEGNSVYSYYNEDEIRKYLMKMIPS